MSAPVDRLHRHRASRRSSSGLTLIEMLLAMAILLFAVTATLIVYDESWRFFKKGRNVVEQQQGVRIGFDHLVQDLRMAGFNHNPDGDPARPDEQIEAAFDTAIVIRADFDARDATRRDTPELSLAGGSFDAVSTGNDEIVVYALAKPDGPNRDSILLDVDVADMPRDGITETVTVGGLALVHDNPPYNLYRITLSGDSTALQGSRAGVRTLVTENVLSMSFRYYDSTGRQVNDSFNLATVADDIGGLDTAMAAARRSSIRRIEIDLVGLTRDPDPTWLDPQDTNPATRAFRKFRLRGEVTPRNLGLTGVPDLPVM
jgi:hypothetical protein